MENNRREGVSASRGERAFTLTLTAAVLAVILIVNVLLYVLNVNLGIFYITPSPSAQTELTTSLDAKLADAESKGAKVGITFCMPEDELQASSTGA